MRGGVLAAHCPHKSVNRFDSGDRNHGDKNLYRYVLWKQQLEKQFLPHKKVSPPRAYAHQIIVDLRRKRLVSIKIVKAASQALNLEELVRFQLDYYFMVL